MPINRNACRCAACRQRDAAEFDRIAATPVAVDRLVVGRTVSLEMRGSRTYIHPRARILRPRGKQETPDYVDPFNVDADWEERA